MSPAVCSHVCVNVELFLGTVSSPWQPMESFRVKRTLRIAKVHTLALTPSHTHTHTHTHTHFTHVSPLSYIHMYMYLHTLPPLPPSLPHRGLRGPDHCPGASACRRVHVGRGHQLPAVFRTGTLHRGTHRSQRWRRQVPGLRAACRSHERPRL